jgi:hypothetical protein
LALRFTLTHEFQDFSVDDWLDNKKWFDIKLLVDAGRSGVDYCKSMTNSTFSDAVKKVLRALGIPSAHWVHLGRVMGPKILELLDEEADEIRRLGNWDPFLQELSYSTKLPLKPIRKIAGYTTGTGMYYNVRSTVKPSAELLRSTPFGWAFDALEGVEKAMTEDGSVRYTALCFLKFICELAMVFLQDAAAMWVLHPERRSHPMYRIDTFSSQEWRVSRHCC